MSLFNGMRTRLFLTLEKRFDQIMQEKQCNSITAFTEAFPEWEALLGQHGIEVHRRKSRSKIEAEVHEVELVCDPGHYLGLRLGILTGTLRFLEMSNETAMRILALGELP